MNLEFDLGNITITEFGIARHDRDNEAFLVVPVDAGVQAALHEIVQSTWDAMQRYDDGPRRYEPAEKHASTEYLYVPLEDDLAVSVRELHEASNFTIDSAALSDPSSVSAYFARLTDSGGRRLTALRRATQFKGMVKSKNRLVRQIDDTLMIVEDTVFKLDNDFDLLIDARNVHILRPSGFETTCKLKQAILAAVPENVAAICKELPFVEFAGIEEYASSRSRAARLLASIRGQAGTSCIEKARLKMLCEQTGVEINESHGKLCVASGHEMGFLEVLDRRRYEVNLVRESPERYRAGSRRRIDG